MSDPLDEPYDPLEWWPNCAIPDCGNKVCTWGSDCYCAPHAAELVGPDEMIRRWDATHDEPWPHPGVFPSPRRGTGEPG